MIRSLPTKKLPKTPRPERQRSRRQRLPGKLKLKRPRESKPLMKLLKGRPSLKTRKVRPPRLPPRKNRPPSSKPPPTMRSRPARRRQTKLPPPLRRAQMMQVKRLPKKTLRLLQRRSE